jgi:hypothetical protein
VEGRKGKKPPRIVVSPHIDKSYAWECQGKPRKLGQEEEFYIWRKLKKKEKISKKHVERVQITGQS